jgi:hypothetical protein
MSKRYNIYTKTDRLADQGWSAMRENLDREMPHKERRRRYAVWWMAATLVGIASGWLLHDLYQTYPQPQQDQLVVASAHDNTARRSVLDVEMRSSSAPAIQSNVAVSAPPQAMSACQSTNPLLQNTLSESIASAPTILIDQAVTTATNVAPLAQVLERGNHQIHQLASLDQLALHVPQSIDYQRDIPQLRDPISTYPIVQPIRKKRATEVHWGVTSAVSMGEVNRVPGMALGIQMDAKGRHDRSGLRIGLLYRYQRMSMDNRPIVPISYKSYLDATGDALAGDSSSAIWRIQASRSPLLVPITDVHRLEIPALLTVQINKHWNLHAGASFARLLAVGTADRSFFTYNLRVVKSPNERVMQQLSQAVTNHLPRWERNWQLGFAYKPTKHLEFGLYYRQVWLGKVALSDNNDVLQRCAACQDIPGVADQLRNSVRPQSLQLNASWRF